jgi:hypothetical protein
MLTNTKSKVITHATSMITAVVRCRFNLAPISILFLPISPNAATSDCVKIAEK